jgi:ribonuclease D
LKTLIKEFINVDISKQFQSSDFGGELTPAQLKYCANDVIYLHKIHDELDKILKRENRINLYQNCLKFLITRVELDLASFKEDIWSH